MTIRTLIIVGIAAVALVLTAFAVAHHGGSFLHDLAPVLHGR